MGELGAWGANLTSITDKGAIGRIAKDVGMMAKREATNAAQRSLGADAAMSHFKGGGKKLSAGFDVAGSTVTVNFKGPWALADKGRKASGPIFPKGGKGKGKGVISGRAVMTPMGPRARSSFGPSRGLGTLDDASDRIKNEAGQIASKAFRAGVAAALGKAASGLGGLGGSGSGTLHTGDD